MQEEEASKAEKERETARLRAKQEKLKDKQVRDREASHAFHNLHTSSDTFPPFPYRRRSSTPFGPSVQRRRRRGSGANRSR